MQAIELCHPYHQHAVDPVEKTPGLMAEQAGILTLSIRSIIFYPCQMRQTDRESPPEYMGEVYRPRKALSICFYDTLLKNTQGRLL